MVYYSRISLRLISFIIIIFVGVSIAPIHELLSTRDEPAWIPIIIIWLTFLASLVLVFTRKYVIIDDQLIVKQFGIFSQRYDLRELVCIVPTRDIASAPACSLRRICLSFKTGTVMISPRNQDDFLDQIRRINPDVRIEC